MRFNNTNHRSLNESITHVQNPQAALNEALGYISDLEDVIYGICEELDIHPDDLVEDVMTAERQRQHEKRLAPLYRKARTATGAKSKAVQKAIAKARRPYSAEMRSKKLYGKGGRVLKRKPDVYADSDQDNRGYTD